MTKSDTAIICTACRAENKVGARFCRQCGAQIAAAAAAYDRTKWQALVQYDPDISAAADTVRPFGQMWVDELGASYMALNDKSYLSGIVEKITARAKAEKQRQTEIQAAAAEKARQERQRQADVQAAEAERARQNELERQRIWEERKRMFEKIRAFVLYTNKGRAVFAAMLAVIATAAALAYYLMQPEKIDERIVWKPTDSAALSNLNCASGNASKDCLSDFMEKNGASSQAVAFAREIRDKLSRPNFERHAYAEQVTHFGPVSMVKVVFPFENQGIENEDYLLLSPNRAITDPNNSQFTGFNSSFAPSKQAAFSQLLISFPNALVWPVPDFDHDEKLNQDGRRLVFKYPILNGCHACDLIGWAKFAFDFDAEGQFMGASVYQVMAQQPSFNCTKVHRWAEITVCATPMLAVKDAQMGSLFASDIKRGSPDDRLKLRTSQRAWIKLRDQCEFNGGADCLNQVYATRIAVLSSTGPSGEPAVSSASANQPATPTSITPSAGPSGEPAVSSVSANQHATPIAISPVAGAVFDYFPRHTIYSWSPVPGAVRYGIEIDYGQPPNGPPWYADTHGQGFVENDLTGTTFERDFVGAQPGRWRVWAIFADGSESAKSAWVEFRYLR